MKITRHSQMTGRVHTLDIDITDYQLNEIANPRQNIQDIVPHLTADEREFLMTGIIAKEWEVVFGS